jgi:hypothetical protein
LISIMPITDALECGGPPEPHEMEGGLRLLVRGSCSNCKSERPARAQENVAVSASVIPQSIFSRRKITLR